MLVYPAGTAHVDIGVAPLGALVVSVYVPAMAVVVTRVDAAGDGRRGGVRPAAAAPAATQRLRAWISLSVPGAGVREK